MMLQENECFYSSKTEEKQKERKKLFDVAISGLFI